MSILPWETGEIWNIQIFGRDERSCSVKRRGGFGRPAGIFYICFLDLNWRKPNVLSVKRR